MGPVLNKFIELVIEIANIRDETKRSSARSELENKLLVKFDAFKADGLSNEEAANKTIEQIGDPVGLGYSLRKWPLLDVRCKGTARGVFAIGKRAVGIFASGNVSFGVFSSGYVTAGLFSAGVWAFGLVMCFGALAVGGICFAGLGIGAVSISGASIGLLAFGGASFGLCAYGGLAVGRWAHGDMGGRGGATFSLYPSENAPEIARWFETLVDKYIVHMENNISTSGMLIMVCIFLLLMIVAAMISGYTPKARLAEYERIKKICERMPEYMFMN